jgi:hypothetical protein
MSLLNPIDSAYVESLAKVGNTAASSGLGVAAGATTQQSIPLARAGARAGIVKQITHLENLCYEQGRERGERYGALKEQNRQALLPRGQGDFWLGLLAGLLISAVVAGGFVAMHNLPKNQARMTVAEKTG